VLGSPPPYRFWSCIIHQHWLHRPHKPPVPHSDTPAPDDLDHHLAIGHVLEDDARLVPLGRVVARVILDGN
jgi:hypothetical protein